jgi:hypothetical protein
VRCRDEVRQFFRYRDRALSTNADILGNCTSELRAICQYDGTLPIPRHVLGCLRENKRKASGACAERVLEDQLAAAEDYQKDPAIAFSCSMEARRLCPGTQEGEGHMLACMQDKRQRVRCLGNCNEVDYRSWGVPH